MNTPDAVALHAGDAEVGWLLRAIGRDVAHEVRGPVQSMLVNIEVLRRRAADANVVLDRAAVLEEEVRRLHALSEAFLLLARPAEPGPKNIAVETLLAAIDPLLRAMARGGRVRYEREPVAAALRVRVRCEPVWLALLRLAFELRNHAAGGGEMTVQGTGDAAAVVLRLESRGLAGEERTGGTDGAALNHALRLASTWLGNEGGTADLDGGSDTNRLVINVRLPGESSRGIPPLSP